MVSESLFWPAVFLLLTGLGGLLLDGGYAHYEGQFFLANYLDSRPFIAKIFSAHFNEWDCYQGRELSFLFGWIDAQVVAASPKAGAVHLYSATHFVGIYTLAMVSWRLLPRLFPAVTSAQSGLVVALLLTTPVAALSGFYYRPAKILAAVFLVLTIWILTAVNERAEQKRSAHVQIAALVLVATLLGASDRLGIYMLLLAGVIIAITNPVRRGSRVTLLLALGTALLLNAAWSALAGPALSEMADGYRPDTRDQIVLLRHTFLGLDHYLHATNLVRGSIEQFFGNFGLVSTGFIAGAVALIFVKDRPRGVPLMLGTAIIATLAVYTAMFARLESLVWPASRRVYYWLPQLVILAVGAALLASRIPPILPCARRWVTPILAIMVVGNLIALPGHRALTASHEHRQWIEEAPLLRECIARPATPISAYRISEPYQQVCSAVRVAAHGSAGPGGAISASPNPGLYCRNSGRPRGKL